MVDLNVYKPFYSETNVKTERHKKKIFGISFLDESLRRIVKNDLILIGSTTGTGKTSIALNIAIANSDLGHNVALLSLESYKNEMEDRNTWKLICEEYYKTNKNPIYIRDWDDGEYVGTVVQEIEEKIINKLKNNYPNLKIRYPDVQYTLDRFDIELKSLLTDKWRPDLLIIDHAHFFSYENDENENQALRKIIMRIGNVVKYNNIPVILIAHLRKQNRKSDFLLPDESEFHGCSDLVKVPTTIITLAPAFDLEESTKYKFLTYFTILKVRKSDIGPKKHIFLTTYDIKTNKYSQEYTLYKNLNNYLNKKIIPFDSLPSWAENAKRIFNEDEVSDEL